MVDPSLMVRDPPLTFIMFFLFYVGSFLSPEGTKSTSTSGPLHMLYCPHLDYSPHCLDSAIKEPFL